jgi:hypothetical protein
MLQESSPPGGGDIVFRARLDCRFKFLLHGSGNLAMMIATHLEPRMSSAVYTATVLTSARAAAGMTSRARRPMARHSAG